MYIIYQVINKINGKKYIGKTGRGLEVRWKSHTKEAEYLDNYFHRAIKKHGFDSFELKILEEIFDEDVCSYLEMFWISALKTYNPKIGYNGTFGGEGGNQTPETCAKISVSKMGHSVSEEARFKMSQARLGSKHTEEWKKEASERMKGNKYAEGVVFSEDRKRKQSETLKTSPSFIASRIAMIGVKHSPEHKKKISDAITGEKNPFYGHKHSEESKNKMRKAKLRKVSGGTYR